ncbi:MAG TPA: PilZ domain-containing protein [Anaeromyxobacteraceae bacterium]|nr:PilZ domain-containing protein [Anaeromyxobacteraceae bacterium]
MGDEYVYNPRRAPRALVGCEAHVQREVGTSFGGTVIDCGPSGVQLVTPAPLGVGERVVLELRSPALSGVRVLRGRVAWSAAEPPFRAGVHFDAAALDEAALLYGHLAAAHPELVDVDEVPDRLPLGARIVPWRREEDAAVLPGEEAVLIAVGPGVRLAELRERLGARWGAALNPLFALLARKLLVVEE